MPDDRRSQEPLPRSLQIALNYAPAVSRSWFASFFQLDALLGRIVATGREPMLAQLRLAWWRDELKQNVLYVKGPTPLLNHIRQVWRGAASPLVALVDGWECLVDDAIDDETVSTFCAGRAEVAEALARHSDCTSVIAEVRVAAERWSLAELVARTADPSTATRLIARVSALPDLCRLPRALAPFAVLDALARRSVRAGGKPLADGNMALIVAARAGQFGR